MGRQPISETILFFEIPVLRSCNNFIVDLDVVEGEADVNFFPDTAYRVCSTLRARHRSALTLPGSHLESYRLESHAR